MHHFRFSNGNSIPVSVVENDAKFLGKIELSDDKPKLFISNITRLVAIIHSSGSVSLFGDDLTKLWNCRFNGFTPIDLLFSPCEHYMGVVLRRDKTMPSNNTIFRIFSIEDTQNILYDLDLDDNYQCACWNVCEYGSEIISSDADTILNAWSKNNSQSIKKPKSKDINRLQDLLYKQHHKTESTFLLSRILPKSSIIPLVGENKPPTMLVVATKHSAYFYMNAYTHVITVSLRRYIGDKCSRQFVKNVMLDENFCNLFINTIRRSEEVSNQFILLGSILNDKHMDQDIAFRGVVQLLIRYGHFLTTIRALLTEIDQQNVSLNSFMDSEFFYLVKRFYNTFESSLVPMLLQILIFGIVPPDMLPFLSKIHIEKLGDSLMDDIPEIKVYWSKLSKVQEFLELLLINLQLLKNHILHVMAKYTFILSSKDAEIVSNLFSILEHKIQESLSECIKIFQQQQEEAIIKGVENFYLWVKELAKCAANNDSNVITYTAHEKFGCTIIGESSDKLQCLIEFVGKKLPMIIKFILNKEDCILNRKLDTQYIKVAHQNLVEYLQQKLGENLFSLQEHILDSKSIKISCYTFSNKYITLSYYHPKDNEYLLVSYYTHSNSWCKYTINLSSVYNNIFNNDPFCVIDLIHTFKKCSPCLRNQSHILTITNIVKKENGNLASIKLISSDHPKEFVSEGSHIKSFIRNIPIKYDRKSPTTLVKFNSDIVVVFQENDCSLSLYDISDV